MRVGMIIKPNKPEALSLAQGLIQWLKKQKVETCLEEAIGRAIGHPIFAHRAEIRRGIELLIVLGGDGTLLSAVRALEGESIPILGVNLGGLGFLTEVTLEEIYPVLEKILQGQMEIERRMKLCADVLRRGFRVGAYSVLNDVVLSKSVLARVIDLRLNINQAYVSTYRGDGVIVSTPTGSTAYSLAAGGPIVYPSLDSILITPICPHALTNRPLLIPDSSRVELTMEAEESDIHLTLDGQIGCALQPGDRIVVTKSPEQVLFIKPPGKDYFQILRTKFKWGER